MRPFNTIPEILMACQTHEPLSLDRASFNSIIFNSANTEKDRMSIAFNNIDGNASNFNGFVVFNYATTTVW